MEKAVRKATENIAGSTSGLEEVSVLTSCAIDIATIAFTAYKDTLRKKALGVANAIADFEDELKQLSG